MNEEYKKMFRSLWLILKTKSVDELNFLVHMPEDNDFASYKFQPESIRNHWRIRNFELSEQNRILMANFLDEMLSEKLPYLWSRLYKRGHNYSNIQFLINITTDRQVEVILTTEYYDTEDNSDEYTVEDDPKLANVFNAIGMLNPNITTAELDFEGSGDSGAIDSDIVTDQGTYRVPDSVERWCYGILPPGWEINEGSSGRFTFDLDNKTVETLVSENIEGSMEDTILVLSF